MRPTDCDGFFVIMMWSSWRARLIIREVDRMSLDIAVVTDRRPSVKISNQNPLAF